MNIDKVYFICRDPGNDRYWAQMGALGVMGVPSDRVECFQGIDAREDKFSTIAKLADAMVDDGFEEWGIHRDTKEYLDGPRSLAVGWSHLRCLRQIVDRGENAIVLEDDCHIIKPFDEMEKLLSYLPSGMKCLHLDWTTLIETHDKIWSDYRYRQRIRRTDVDDIYTGYIPPTHRAKFYTLEGAKEKFEAWKDKPWQDGEGIMWERNAENDVSGYYFALPRWALLWCIDLKTNRYEP